MPLAGSASLQRDDGATTETVGSDNDENSTRAGPRTRANNGLQHQELSQRRQRRKRARISSKRVNFTVRVEDFAVLETPHPYGILPGGNRFLLLADGSGVVTAADAGGGSRRASPTALLSDECWYRVLEFCGGEDLGSLLQTCRYFYASGSEPELWRDLVLIRRAHKTITTAGPTWKDAYVRLHLDDEEREDRDIDCRPHVPLSVCGVYSDFFYRLHSCRSFAIPAGWMDPESGTLTRIAYKDMTVKMFAEQYEQPNRPVVVKGAARTWKAFQRWSQPRYLLEHCAPNSQPFRATSGAAPLPGMFTLQAYYDYCQSTHLEEAPLYLFDRTALAPGSRLWEDYADDLKSTCPYWDPDWKDLAHDLFKVLGEGRRPDHTWLIVGPRRSGSVFHIDPNATHAWNAAIVGRKFWIFYPPGVAPPGVMPSQDGDEVGMLSIFFKNIIAKCQ